MTDDLDDIYTDSAHDGRDCEAVTKEGGRAYRRGDSVSDCPYSDRVRRSWWADGWLDAQALEFSGRGRR